MFFLAMAQYPTIQARARAEVDSVVGRDRMPEMSDIDNMPYLAALLKEIMRFHVQTPLIVPHATSQDDIHDGYFIAKGTTVIANLWFVFPSNYINSLLMTFPI